METKFLESSEFYQRRYDNFSTLIILPICFAVVALITFSFFGKKEITVKSVGEIVPSNVISVVQSTSNDLIVTNNLKENREVHKGDVLITYDTGQSSEQLKSLHAQLNVAQQKQTAIRNLLQGLTDDSQAVNNDAFGYGPTLSEYRAQIEKLNKDAQSQRQAESQQQNTAQATRNAINAQIEANNSQISDYTELRQTVNDRTDLPQDNTFGSMYAVYTSQLSQASDSGEDAQQIKETMLSNIDSAIRQLQDSNRSLQTQQAGISGGDTNANDVAASIQALRSQYIASANKDLSQVETEILQLQTNIALAQTDPQSKDVAAAQDGVLHVEDGIEGLKTIAAGTAVAQIYPALNEQTKLSIQVMVPSSEIDGIQDGQTVRLSCYQNSPTPLVLNGDITTIAAAPTRTQQGNYYKVEANFTPTQEQINQIRYGLQGETTIITGRKTIFKYYLDALLHH